MTNCAGVRRHHRVRRMRRKAQRSRGHRAKLATLTRRYARRMRKAPTQGRR